MLPPLAREGGRPLLYVMTAGEVATRRARRCAMPTSPILDHVAEALAVLRALEAGSRRPRPRALCRRLRPDGAGPPAHGLPAGALTRPRRSASPPPTASR